MRSQVYTLLQVLGVTLYDIVVVQQAGEFSIVSYLSKRAASCTWIREENSIEVAHISTTFVRIVFSLVTSSYYLELVTELSCLLFYISYFCLHHSFTTTYFSHVCFPQLSVSSGDQAFSNANCRAYHLLVLEIIIFSLFLCLPNIPFLSWRVCRQHHMSIICSVSKSRSFVTLYNSTSKLIDIWEFVECEVQYWGIP